MEPDAQAPELLDALFELGCDLLLGNLDAVWAGLAAEAAAQPQVRVRVQSVFKGEPEC